MSKKVFEESLKRGHEQVVFFSFPEFGLKALIGIHDTTLGPALGGCRLRMYEDEDQALDDVLRLSEGMTYKSSIAGLDLGGGKSCIIADPSFTEGREKFFEQFGKCLEYLGGRYITAEDMGTSVEDVMCMRRQTQWAAGFSREAGGAGDPSPWTARGVFHAIRAACERVFDKKDLSGKKIAIQGVGHVGMYLAELLHAQGATLTVCDAIAKNAEKARERFGVNVVAVEDIYDVDCDVFAPCAIGQTINEVTIPRLKCRAIAGAANNQISSPAVYASLNERGMLYCPDFVINSGGVISVGGEYIPGGWNEGWVSDKVDHIYHTTHRILDESEKRKAFPEVVAVELAKERIQQKKAEQEA